MKGFIPANWFNKNKAAKNNTKTPEINLSEQKILVVDDSKTQLFAIRKMLEEFGFSVVTAENGRSGILKARQEKPNLILMDIVMPEVNGFQATRYLTRHPETSQIPIIIVSGSTQEADKAWGLKLGARDFLTKPIEAGMLITKIIRLLHTNHLQAQSLNSEQQKIVG